MQKYHIRTFWNFGREPWSTGYGRRLISKGCGFKSQHRILDGRFSNIFVVEIVMTVWKDENKWEKGPGMGYI